MSDLDPSTVVASFDSASVLLAANAAALRGQPFPHLGSSRVQALGARAASHLPWGLLRGLYTRIGASEGIPVKRLGDVDLAAVASWFTESYPHRRYPAVMIGSSNGALTHLASAMQVPWLPQTVLVPVAHVDDPDRVDRALEFGCRVAGPLLDRNPDIALHHMHDPAQDQLMSARMSYFRVKWTAAPNAYRKFITDRLEPGGTVILVNDTSTWPITRVSERHVFQTGGRGGVSPAEYLARPHAPAATGQAPEAEWGAEPAFVDDVRSWCARQGHQLTEINYGGPQIPAEPVADIMRAWYRGRGEPANRLVVPSFVLGDPWETISSASVPFWTFFPVQPALTALDAYLAQAEPYEDIHLFLFEHGADSPGIATPQDFEEVVRAHGATPHVEAVRPQKFPHDIGSLGRYGPAYTRLPRARQPWSPLPVDDAMNALANHGLTTGHR